MATRWQHIASELQVLQEAVASAVHELSQPLNVVNLLADNALEDVTTLQAEGAADAGVLSGLRRRVEAIVEQAGKASDITRWVRAFAVGIGEDLADFDPDAVIERVAGIFANDLRVAGVRLIADPVPGTRLAGGSEALLGFALTETILWLSRVLPEPAGGNGQDEGSGRQIRISCSEDPLLRSIAVAISGDVVAAPPAGHADDGTAAPAPPGVRGEGRIPPALPLLTLAGRAPGCTASMSKTARGGIRVRLSLPSAALDP